jgi:hypothetical protein
MKKETLKFNPVPLYLDSSAQLSYSLRITCKPGNEPEGIMDVELTSSEAARLSLSGGAIC